VPGDVTRPAGDPGPSSSPGHRHVVGPAGPRLVPAEEAAMLPETDDPHASVHRAGRAAPLETSPEPIDR
jgi:hypothetical protein